MRQIYLLALFLLVAATKAMAQTDNSNVYSTYVGKLQLQPSGTSRTASYVIEGGEEAGTANITLKSLTIGTRTFTSIKLVGVPITYSNDGIVFGNLEGQLVESEVVINSRSYTATMAISLEGSNNKVEGDSLTIATKATYGDNTFHTVFAGKNTITGIEQLTADYSEPAQSVAIYYDLAGRRVASPQKGVIYICKGKKVVL